MHRRQALDSDPDGVPKGSTSSDSRLSMEKERRIWLVGERNQVVGKRRTGEQAWRGRSALICPQAAGCCSFRLGCLFASSVVAVAGAQRADDGEGLQFCFPVIKAFVFEEEDGPKIPLMDIPK